jgi:hypothetical protein
MNSLGKSGFDAMTDYDHCKHFDIQVGHWSIIANLDTPSSLPATDPSRKGG